VHWQTVPALAGRVRSGALARLERDPEVRRIDLDSGGGRVGDVESLHLIGADAVQATGLVGRGVAVAVLDTGIDRTHPDLSTSLVGEHCVIPPSGCPGGVGEADGPGSAQDDNGHGTNVAGIITGDGHIAPIGEAPAANVVAVKVIDRTGAFQSSSQLVSALDWIATARPDVKVVNMSLGTTQLFPSTCDDAASWTMALAAAVHTLRLRGVTVFASSMNDGATNALAAPACLREVVSVGAVYDSAFGPLQILGCTDAVTAADEVACWSNSGPKLDLLAPGALVTATGLGSKISTYAGTSQASPHAAGAAALLLQADPALTPDELVAQLERTGKIVVDPRNSRATPRIDVAAAVAALQTGGPPTPKAQMPVRALAFGRVRVGHVKRLRLSISNAGTAALDVSAKVALPFAVATPVPLAVAPSTSASLVVSFRPRRRGTFRRTLTLTTNDASAARIAVSLSGTGRRR
jgi:subtilisin family serine protease